MIRTRAAALALTSVLAVGVGVGVAPAAAATHAHPNAAVDEDVDVDVDRTLVVRLGGPGDGVRVGSSVLGDVVVAPGDSGGSLLRVRNDGPTAGTLTASIVDAVAFRDADDEGWVDDSFYDDLTINDVPASELEGKTTEIRRVELDRGASVDIPVTYDFPAEMTSGNRSVVGERVFSFDVLLRIEGDLPDDPGAGDGASALPQGDGSGLVTHTGGAALPADLPWLTLLAALLTLVAATSARALRRERARVRVERRE